jgi:hypothetical protein
MNISHTIRNRILSAAASFAVVAASIVAAPGVASADTSVAARRGPGKLIVITDPITLTLDCDETWNPTCTTTAVSNQGIRIYSFFYIDGIYRGAGNVAIPTVCSRFRLRDGWHSARLYARDSQHNAANIGPALVIKCDRTAPLVRTGVRTLNGIVSANPTAIDKVSGVDTATLEFLVDGTAATWQPYSSLCTQLTLTTGAHVAIARAKDIAGNQGAASSVFQCP